MAPAAAEELETLERDLSMYNIVLMRQQAELDAKKLKPAAKEQSGGWFGWITGRGKQAPVGEGMVYVEGSIDWLVDGWVGHVNV